MNSESSACSLVIALDGPLPAVAHWTSCRAWKDAREQAHQWCNGPQSALLSLSAADREKPPLPVVSLQGHGAPVVAVAWAFDERRLASSDVSTNLVALVAFGWIMLRMFTDVREYALTLGRMRCGALDNVN